MLRFRRRAWGVRRARSWPNGLDAARPISFFAWARLDLCYLFRWHFEIHRQIDGWFLLASGLTGCSRPRSTVGCHCICRNCFRRACAPRGKGSATTRAASSPPRAAPLHEPSLGGCVSRRLPASRSRYQLDLPRWPSRYLVRAGDAGPTAAGMNADAALGEKRPSSHSESVPEGLWRHVSNVPANEKLGKSAR